MNVYLDIDGVLLNKNLSPANHVHQFLEAVTQDNEVYWLTTHCKGDATLAYELLKAILEPETIQLLKNIKATNWNTAKTEGIDFSQPFLWFDDNLFYGEKLALSDKGVLDNWIKVDLQNKPDQLAEFAASFPLPVTQ
ncbi:MAG TPA: hypothetical protein VHT70_00835 [Candidatus Saccharimonadales bacterium]|jgi:hypothetical protein|nr:hypothetical protein [Candidatus Saccharimonadales bacterium]